VPAEKQLAARTAIVIGGGLVGMACAIALQSRGIATIVVDPVSVRRAASWGNAGHLAAEQVEPLASIATLLSVHRRLFRRGGALALPPRDVATWLPFAARLMVASGPARFAAGKAALSGALAEAIPAWRRLLARAGAPQLLREEGHFVVWETAATARRGCAFWEAADTGTARFRDATDAELARISSLMARRPAAAIRFTGTGQIADLGALGETLGTHFESLGGIQRCAAAAGLDLSNGAAVVTLDSGEVLAADAVVLAAGVGSKALGEKLGYRIPLIAERGYHIEGDPANWPQDLPPLVLEDRSMIVTRFASGIRAASFVEFAAASSPPDPAKWARLRSHVASLGLPFGEPVRQWMGARPTLPDYLPAIGRSSRAQNLFYAFGHQHLGLTLSAVTGEAIGALVAGEPPPIDLSRFDLERFQR
jgi:D-amino-acid dehydrogenase